MAVDIAWVMRMTEAYPVTLLRQATSVTFVPAAIGKVVSRAFIGAEVLIRVSHCAAWTRCCTSLVTSKQNLANYSLASRLDMTTQVRMGRFESRALLNNTTRPDSDTDSGNASVFYTKTVW